MVWIFFPQSLIFKKALIDVGHLYIINLFNIFKKNTSIPVISAVGIFYPPPKIYKSILNMNVRLCEFRVLNIHETFGFIGLYYLITRHHNIEKKSS